MSGWLGAPRVDLQRCGSTNDEAAARARAGAAHGTVVIAREQSAGRGRQAREWHSPAADNLYLSCVLRPALAPRDVAPITLAAGVAVCEVVNSHGVRASLKWPNDVMVNERKVAGILTEMTTRGSQVEFAVLGIGVNVNGGDFPPGLADIATSLRIERGHELELPALTRDLLVALEDWIEAFIAGGVEAIAAAWTGYADLSRRLRFEADGELIVGRASGLDRDGALLVVGDDGRRHRVVAGDVDLLR